MAPARVVGRYALWTCVSVGNWVSGALRKLGNLGLNDVNENGEQGIAFIGPSTLLLLFRT